MHKPLLHDLAAELEGAIAESDFILGKSVENFESDFALFSNSQFCVGVSSGTSAIHLALEAIGIGPGDEVIVPANSFTATAAAVVRTGARPRFADVDSLTMLLTPETIAPHMNDKTRAVIPVHLHGNVADVEAIARFVGPDIGVIEDCAQAHGARFESAPVGSFSLAAAYSFYPGKNLGALGDAGAITTNDPAIAETLRIQRSWGQVPKHQRGVLGYNERLDALQARFLRVKLRALPAWEARRSEIAEEYNSAFSGITSISLPDARNKGRVWHVYALQVADRDFVRERLASLGIETKVHYSSLIPSQAPYCHLESGHFPVSAKQVDSQLSLPLDPLMTEDELGYIVNSVRSVLQ